MQRIEPNSPEQTAAPVTSGGRRRRYWLLALLVLAIIGAFVVKSRVRPSTGQTPATPGSAAAGARIVPVVAAKVERRDVPIYLDGLGSAVPLATVVVHTQVEGRLDRVLFTEGQQVKKGQELAQIDPRPFLIALHQAQAAELKDSATARNAERNLQRYKALLEQRLVPQQQVDDQQTAFDQAQATLASDRAQIESAKLNLDYARIKSPIDGVVGVRQIDPGNLVHTSDTNGIVVVTQLDPMGVVFSLPEAELGRVAAALAAGPVAVEAYGREPGKRVATGKLALIDNQVNQATATIRLKAIFPNPDRVLWPSAFIKARLLLTTEKDALVIPAAAVQRGPEGTFVYIVAPDQTAAMRPIQVGLTEDVWSTVTSGLTPGDSVIVEGQNQLRPGAKVSARAGARSPGSAERRP